MKNTPTVPNQLHALLLALISAVALHGLLLSYLQLQRNKVTLPEGLQSRDNTPELLQFSSQPTPLTKLDLLPLPQASILPPPRIQVPAKSSGAKQKSQTRTASKSLTQTVKKNRSVGTAPMRPSSPELPKDIAVAVEALHLFKGTGVHPSTLQDDHPKTLSSLTPAQLEAYDRLWAQARPQPKETVEKLNLSLAEPSLEIRSVSLQQAQNKQLSIRHQQFVVLHDRVALFWLEGQKLWILQSFNLPATQPDSANESKG
jgi:hypothetical protein